MLDFFNLFDLKYKSKKIYGNRSLEMIIELPNHHTNQFESTQINANAQRA